MGEFDLKIRSRDIDTLLDIIKIKNPDGDFEIIKKAYRYAEEHHRGQKRLSGEPYIIHPLEVSIILANLNLDIPSITAALLHDVIEDTEVSFETLENEFSYDVAVLVDGVTKISSIKNRSKATAQAETLRKMLIATIKDLRVIIIKLADKLHNMRTLMFQPEHKQLRIARETLDIYAPIARRLGMSRMSSELEDLSFHITNKQEYNEIKNYITQRDDELHEYLENIKSILKEQLDELNINIEIIGRAKHYYSIFRKMRIQDKSFEEIYDIRAVRIITDEVKDCYGILGTIHSIWTPITARFKDYIAVPKTNMYQSLHTTVIGPGGFPLEVQIRTKKMDETANMGIAAHWVYKDKLKGGNKKNYRDLALLQNINKLYSKADTSRDFMADLKMDLYEDEIFVFTPRGKIIKLPLGSTPVDFAYAIHTEVGQHTTGAKINNKIAQLKSRINSGDIVEIQTSKNGHPSEAWLKFVKSSRARYKIRSWVKKNAALNKSENETSAKKEKIKREDKTTHVKITSSEKIKIDNLSKKEKIGVKIDGTSNLLIRLSQCCQPIPGDDVIGFITRGRGVTIHKKSCPSLKRLINEKERIIEIQWEDSDSTLYPIKLAVEGFDRPNLLKDILDEITSCKSNILKIDAQVVENNNANFKFILEVKSNKHLSKLLKKIGKIKSITSVYKLNEKVVLK